MYISLLQQLHFELGLAIIACIYEVRLLRRIFKHRLLKDDVRFVSKSTLRCASAKRTGGLSLSQLVESVVPLI